MVDTEAVQYEYDRIKGFIQKCKALHLWVPVLLSSEEIDYLIIKLSSDGYYTTIEPWALYTTLKIKIRW